MKSFKISLIAVTSILVILVVVNLTMKEAFIDLMSGGKPSISHETHALK